MQPSGPHKQGPSQGLPSPSSTCPHPREGGVHGWQPGRPYLVAQDGHAVLKQLPGGTLGDFLHSPGHMCVHSGWAWQCQPDHQWASSWDRCHVLRSPKEEQRAWLGPHAWAQVPRGLSSVESRTSVLYGFSQSFFFWSFWSFCVFKAAPEAYGSSQAREL